MFFPSEPPIPKTVDTRRQDQFIFLPFWILVSEKKTNAKVFCWFLKSVFAQILFRTQGSALFCLSFIVNCMQWVFLQQHQQNSSQKCSSVSHEEKLFRRTEWLTRLAIICKIKVEVKKPLRIDICARKCNDSFGNVTHHSHQERIS